MGKRDKCRENQVLKNIVRIIPRVTVVSDEARCLGHRDSHEIGVVLTIIVLKNSSLSGGLPERPCGRR